MGDAQVGKRCAGALGTSARCGQTPQLTTQLTTAKHAHQVVPSNPYQKMRLAHFLFTISTGANKRFCMNPSENKQTIPQKPSFLLFMSMRLDAIRLIKEWQAYDDYDSIHCALFRVFQYKPRRKDQELLEDAATILHVIQDAKRRQQFCLFLLTYSPYLGMRLVSIPPRCRIVS